MTPEGLDRALEETPDAVGATVVSPTYFGAVADVAGLTEVALALKAGKRVVGLGTWDVEGVDVADSPETAVETVLRDLTT